MSDLFGLIGVALIVIAYGALQLDKIRSDSATYSTLNLLGAILIIAVSYTHLTLPTTSRV